MERNNQLTTHFTLSELTTTAQTDKEIKKQQANITDEIYNNIKSVAELLESAREQLKAPIFVTSGYRGELLNKKIGGAKNSDHLKGAAADIVADDMPKLFEILKTKKFKQLIKYQYEGKNGIAWIHVSTVENQNYNEIMLCKIANNGAKTYIIL